MFSSVYVVLIVAIIARIQALNYSAPRHAGPHCLIAVDLLNSLTRDEANKERQFVLDIGKKLLDIENAAAAIWCYAHSSVPEARSPAQALNRMTSNLRVFEIEVQHQMEYGGIPQSQSNKQVLETLNNMSPAEWDGKANCVIYLSFLKSANDLEKLVPKGDAVKKVVVVSLLGGDLSPLLDTNRGAMVIVDVAGGYTSKNAEDVIKAMRSNFWNQTSHN